MSRNNSDRALNKLLIRAIVPIGLRPRTDDQIAGMLNTIGGAALDAERLQRILRKVNGTECVGPAPEKTLPHSAPPLSASEQGLIALHRAQGASLPLSIEQRLRELERQAAEPSDKKGGEANA